MRSILLLVLVIWEFMVVYGGVVKRSDVADLQTLVQQQAAAISTLQATVNSLQAGFNTQQATINSQQVKITGLENKVQTLSKTDEVQKRPPRPRLDTINTARDIRKWLPTITRDIEFYVKQMEVPCYTDNKIEEFKDRIQRLKQEYRAYLHKLRTLEPDVSASSWSNRPYSSRKRQAERSSGHSDEPGAQGIGQDSSETNTPASGSSSPASKQAFTPIATPVLQNMPLVVSTNYGFEPPPPVVWNANPETEDEPLQFGPMKAYPAICLGGDGCSELERAEIGERGSSCSEESAEQRDRLKKQNRSSEKEGTHWSDVDSNDTSASHTLSHHSQLSSVQSEHLRLSHSAVTESDADRLKAVNVHPASTEPVNSEIVAGSDVNDCESGTTKFSSRNPLLLDYSDSSDEDRN